MIDPWKGREMIDPFWVTIKEQLKELESAKSADDVVRILAHEKNPYGFKCGSEDAFFAGGGGDDSVQDALIKAGWDLVWSESSTYYTMRAPDGSLITYIEGDIRKTAKP